ncbi:PQ loop repeat family protein [Tritrichomonas foetus]|uniref:PQ loop repeat family protein n=1 Tax=Tritrichomonas foetus TaxID=1144522 RepID=A0A1J4L596_9EUKA|nr:PQ loop repeat family protein [Tritrichomonas foetus]|eukprot:OHT17164.1 PQ loop repeat family protein [Tritrichomonas foetus]
MGWSCGFDYPSGIACWLGNIASLCFFIVYVPQFMLNYNRKSVKGFNLPSTALKLVGSSFLFINSLYNNSSFPVFLYGFLNTMQHAAFLFQFWIYDNRPDALLLLFIILIPVIICQLFPFLIPYTDLIKPICQIVSHIPQLMHCIRIHTTSGISMLGQHLNLIGCVLGCLMCFLIDEQSIKTWLIYFNSGFQSFSMYLVAFWYHEMRIFDSPQRRQSVRRERVRPEYPLL